MPSSAPSTQRYLPFSEIRDDCLIMNDGTLRGVIMTSSINFALKSEDEQEAVVQSYTSFLNGLTFQLQIIIQSRPVRIDNYIESIEKQENKTTNELLKLQLREYKTFIRELVTLGDIMSKKFYIVVPYAPGKESYRDFFSRITDIFSVGSAVTISRMNFEKNKEELSKRIDQVISALGSMSLTSRRLDTQALIELFYNSYNPVSAYQQPMADIEKMEFEQDTSVVKN